MIPGSSAPKIRYTPIIPDFKMPNKPKTEIPKETAIPEESVKTTTINTAKEVSEPVPKKRKATRKGPKYDIAGQKFNNLTAISFCSGGKYAKKATAGKWKCLCDCGKTVYADYHSLKTEAITKCPDCLQKEKNKKHVKSGDYSYLVGQRFNKLTIKSVYRNYQDQGKIHCVCLCDCGNEKDTRYDNIRNGHTTSCGCAFSNRQKNTKKKTTNPGTTGGQMLVQTNDLTGQTFGNLTVVERIEDKVYGTKRITRQAQWKCKCICGKYRNAATYLLTSGQVKKCGRDCTGLPAEKTEPAIEVAETKQEPMIEEIAVKPAEIKPATTLPAPAFDRKQYIVNLYLDLITAGIDVKTAETKLSVLKECGFITEDAYNKIAESMKELDKM